MLHILSTVGIFLSYSNLGKKSEEKERASIVSPAFHVGKTSCLRITVTSEKETRLQVSVFASPDVFDATSAEFFEIVVAGMKVQKFNILLSNNAQRVMFSCEPRNDNTLHLHSVALLSDYQACSSKLTK